MSKIAIIGSGSWGVALATHLAKQGNEIKIWSFEEEEKRLINEEKKCKFLPGLKIDSNITCSNQLKEVIEGTQFILHVTPSKLQEKHLGNIKTMLEISLLLFVLKDLKKKH